MITVTATIKNGFVEVSVIDNGIGMNQKIKDTLFKLGEKNTRPGTNQESGSGLGLLLSKEFIDKHNGKFFVESEEGRGSLFKFIIPAIKELVYTLHSLYDRVYSPNAYIPQITTKQYYKKLDY